MSVDTDHNGLCALTEHNTFRNDLIKFCHKTLCENQDSTDLISSTGKQLPTMDRFIKPNLLWTATPSAPERSEETSADNITNVEPEMRAPT